MRETQPLADGGYVEYWRDGPILAWPGLARIEIAPPECQHLAWWPVLAERPHEPLALNAGDLPGSWMPEAIGARRGYAIRALATLGPSRDLDAKRRLVELARSIRDLRQRGETLAFLTVRAGWGELRPEQEATLRELAAVAPAPSDGWQGADATAWPLLDRLDRLASCAAMLGADRAEALIEPLLIEALALVDNEYSSPQTVALAALRPFLSARLRARAMEALVSTAAWYRRRDKLRALACGGDERDALAAATLLEDKDPNALGWLLGISCARPPARVVCDAFLRMGASVVSGMDDPESVWVRLARCAGETDATIALALEEPMLLPLVACDLVGDQWPRATRALAARKPSRRRGWLGFCWAKGGPTPILFEAADAEVLMAASRCAPRSVWAEVSALADSLSHPAARLAVYLARGTSPRLPMEDRRDALRDGLRGAAHANPVYLLAAASMAADALGSLLSADDDVLDLVLDAAEQSL